MPAREYMGRGDIDRLYAYLTVLAGRGTAAPGVEKITADRLGEFVVKGTCHSCHDASGSRPSADAILMQARIPSLASLLADKSIADFVGKAREGGAISMGSPPLPHRGRMPVFYYLSESEIAAAYRYLGAYPPK